MAPHGKELSEDLKKRIVALHKGGVGKRWPFKMVRYHNFAQFGISLVAVPKFTTMRQCYPNCRESGKERDNGETDQTGVTHSTRPKLINKVVEVKYGITLPTKVMKNVNQPTLTHQSASAAINHVLSWEATHQILANICHSHILICSSS